MDLGEETAVLGVMGMKDVQQIVDQVSAAFSDVVQPASDALMNHHRCECLETSSAFAGKPWADISLDDLLAGRETALLTVEAWRYYLPAMIIWCIRAPDTVDVIQDNLVYQLEPPHAEGASVREWFEPRSKGFTDGQRLAIVAYLEWYRERIDAEWARVGGGSPRHVHRALEFWTR